MADGNPRTPDAIVVPGTRAHRHRGTRMYRRRSIISMPVHGCSLRLNSNPSSKQQRLHGWIDGGNGCPSSSLTTATHLAVSGAARGALHSTGAAVAGKQGDRALEAARSATEGSRKQSGSVPRPTS